MGNALTIAQKEIGTKTGAKYWKYTVGSSYVNGSVTPYCACFVNWCFYKAGLSSSLSGVVNKAYCPSYVQWAKKNGKWSTKPQVGALVLFDWNKDGVADHIGIVEKVVSSSTLKTVEGNTSADNNSYGGQVQRRTRYTSSVLGYVIVKYKTGSASETVKKLDVDGHFGELTVKATQKVLKTTIDGTVSNQPYANKKYLPNAVTGVWQFKKTGYKGGSKMVSAMQKLVGAKQDGYCGPKTVKAMQKFLKVKQSSKMDATTVKAWQKHINTKLK